jgi:hypothetical protein
MADAQSYSQISPIHRTTLPSTKPALDNYKAINVDSVLAGSGCGPRLSSSPHRCPRADEDILFSGILCLGRAAVAPYAGPTRSSRLLRPLCFDSSLHADASRRSTSFVNSTLRRVAVIDSSSNMEADDFGRRTKHSGGITLPSRTNGQGSWSQTQTRLSVRLNALN